MTFCYALSKDALGEIPPLSSPYTWQPMPAVWYQPAHPTQTEPARRTGTAAVLPSSGRG